MIIPGVKALSWRELIRIVFESYGLVAYVFQDYLVELGWAVERVSVSVDNTVLIWSVYPIGHDCGVSAAISLDGSIITIKYDNRTTRYDLARDDCLSRVKYRLDRIKVTILRYEVKFLDYYNEFDIVAGNISSIKKLLSAFGDWH